ncbi:uncharacterized protein LOC100578571 [Apis mellifera]|uniref:Uncharacterized protein LOC100578571 n=1 Tax=Apis mellifera TaxID=7460 RepID=A0A7M7IEQ4_APIME|nr:uncharacterized protein LOC100578571 [Apis mellifera]|eukprot:XP_016766172.1 uncharacterized protein LOC100578571 [Apis mellifera]
MAQLAMFVIAVFLSSQVLADIIVQPGYEHTAQQRVVTQPPETVRQQDNQQQQDRQQERYVDPGYHLELHPVYRNSYHVPSYAVLPISQTGTFPPMSKATYKRLLSSLGEITEVPAIVPAQYYQYFPPAVHSRRKRSNGEKLDGAGQGNKHDENDVAAKPSLTEDAMSVVDLQNQDEKRVKARHSVTLLGLKPSNMRPVHQQYRTYDIPQQMTGSQQALTQVNPQETPQQQQQQQQQAAATPSSQSSNPSDAENVQRSIFLQDHLQPQQFRLEQRKYPELRPLSAGQSSPIVAKSDDHLAARTTSMIPSGGNNEEIVGTKLGDIYKIKVIQNLHQHGRGRTTEKEGVSVNFVNPGNDKGGINKNIATVQGEQQPAAALKTDAEQLVQVYQLSDELGAANYAQNSQYILLPQTYPVNYVGNYVDNYASTVYPYAPLYSSYKICFESPDNLQPIAYQLV